MPRDSSGNYTLPNAPFTPGTTIQSSPVNGNFSDIASTLTASIATDGSSPITGVIKFSSGSAAAPGITFTNDTTSGIYLVSGGNVGISGGGVLQLTVNSSGVTFATPLTSAALASNSVTTVKITDANVTTAKIANLNITTALIANSNVTYAKIQNVSASPRLLGRTTAGAGVIEEISAGTGITLSAGSVSVLPAATTKLDSKTGAAATYDFLSSINSTYRAYRFELDNVLPVTNNVTLQVQVSTDGATWKTTTYESTIIISDGTTVSTGTSTAAVRISAGSVSNTAGYGVSGDITLYAPSGASTRKGFVGHANYHGGDGSIRYISYSGHWDGGNNAVVGVRFTFDSGNIASGTVTMYGIVP